MADASRRIQVGFKDDTLQALEKLSETSGYSLSKCVSVLTEEALVQRGLLNQPDIPASAVSPIIQAAQKAGLQSQLVSKKTEALDDDDLKLLKKLKMLKELGLLN